MAAAGGAAGTAADGTAGGARPEGAAAGGAYDVVVVGGGAAGLSAALTSARALRSTLVVDSGEPRNAPAQGVHGVLGLEGVPPARLLATGRAEVEAYGGRVVAGTATSARRLEGAEVPGAPRFEVGLADGTAVRARRLVVTTGVVDVLPDVPGLAERWGRDLLHCPFCHGREVAEAVVGVLATGAHGVEQALLWRGWAARTVLLQHTGPAPDAGQAERLAARGVDVVAGEVVGVEGADDRLGGVRLADGRVVPLGALVTATRVLPRSGVLEALGVHPEPLVGPGGLDLGAHVPADPSGATSVPGLHLAGTVGAPMAPVAVAAAAGTTVGAVVVKDLVGEDTAAAVAARRAAGGPGPGAHGRARAASR